MSTRRQFLGGVGLSGTLLGPGAFARASAETVAFGDTAVEQLHEQIRAMPVDDTHCHPISDADSQTTPDRFLERLALPAFPAPAYFPDGVLEQWRNGDRTMRATLDRRHDITATLDTIIGHFSESVFVKFMVKEMAGFLGCRPRLPEVIEARNERGRDYHRYIRDLFRDARIGNVMLDTGYSDGLDADGMARFSLAIEPAEARYIARVETLTDRLFNEDLSYTELLDRYVRDLRDTLDGTGNYGRRTYGMKSYLLPHIGLITPTFDDDSAARSWESYRKSRAHRDADRAVHARRGKVLRERLLTIALEECMERDMPIQFHAGDGEAPSVILRNQHPYYLEEVARFDKNGMMRMPKIIPIHAGYPLVSEAAWLSHLYTNVYFELSLMTPFIHQGLLHRYLEVMEAVPLSKILFGSDAYNVPELYWLAARWGKRYLAEALAVYVRGGILEMSEALHGARMILYLNNREVYGLESPPA